jgi:hypothetical protein
MTRAFGRCQFEAAAQPLPATKDAEAEAAAGFETVSKRTKAAPAPRPGILRSTLVIRRI